MVRVRETDATASGVATSGVAASEAAVGLTEAAPRGGSHPLVTRRRVVALGLLGLFGGAALPALGAGCTTVNTPEAPPQPCDVQIVTLRIYAADNINPNETNNPRPVVVRLYQLKDVIRMENARYDDILLKEKETLADDLMKVDEVIVYPNDLVEIKFERIKEAQFLAGVALFFQPKGQSWKTFYQFPPMPGEAAKCGPPPPDGGKVGETEPQVSFFVESTKIDNGSQFDESMFPNSVNIRRVSLPKGSANPESIKAGSAGGAPKLPTAPTAPGAPQAPQGPQTPQAPNAQPPGAPKPPMPEAPMPTIPGPPIP